MILSSPTGDVVLVAPNKTSILITSNDNPAGILSLRSPDMVSAPVSQLNEDKDVDTVFTVVRSAGSFGTVSVNWEIVRNDTGSGLVGHTTWFF
ncbi:hypothetical protein DPMN_060730 [Dreissena polymorpha]|uniref:Uncharacterized protein n=1 Tax=Dreissena polymorpha TaxID=45954 RepID=A0A9D4HHQ6_DREPO|nr:hypothetical protein DPMN_060624 [Dreissena polymorpha]KAH3717934.1 hypothetical protein DPMN_060730 [Dreissena polymorpha]